MSVFSTRALAENFSHIPFGWRFWPVMMGLLSGLKAVRCEVWVGPSDVKILGACMHASQE